MTPKNFFEKIYKLYLKSSFAASLFPSYFFWLCSTGEHLTRFNSEHPTFESDRFDGIMIYDVNNSSHRVNNSNVYSPSKQTKAT